MTIKPKKHFNEQDHKLLTIWAADCAEHVLPHFEEIEPEDDRPRKAIEAARAWTRGDLSTVEARKAAFVSHAAARDAKNVSAVAAARAAGHAAAYAVKAASNVDKEIVWPYQRLPEHLRSVPFHALES